MTGYDPMQNNGDVHSDDAKTSSSKKSVRREKLETVPTSHDVRQFTVDADDDNIRVDRWFKRQQPDIPFALVSRWARTGQLRLDGKRVDPGDRVKKGQVLRVPPIDLEQVAPRTNVRKMAELTDAQVEYAQGMVIYKDRSAIVVNKPPGLATQGGTGVSEHLDGYLDALCFESRYRPKLVHRLDKDTSGAILLGRSAGSASHFAKQFAGRTTRKIYWALVMGVPRIDDGVIELPIGKQLGSHGEKMAVDEEEGQSAKSRYRVIARVGNRAAWVELQPFTGRTHQLRVHMAAIGHPIVGDGKYGGKEAFLTGSISKKMHLHARRLRVDAPGGGKIDVKADLPEHFADSLKQLGLEASEGDLPVVEGRGPMTKAIQKKISKQHSKLMRKDQRGERRGRADTKAEAKVDRKAASKAKAKAGKTGTKGSTKLGGGKNKSAPFKGRAGAAPKPLPRTAGNARKKAKR